MKTVDLGQTSEEVVKLLDQARQGDVVVRLADGSEFLLIAIGDFDYEIAKSRTNPKLMALLETRASQKATCSLDEAKRRMGL